MSAVVGMGLCWALLREADVEVIRESGLRSDMLQGEAVVVYEYIVNHYREYGKMPERDTLLKDIALPPELEDLEPKEPAKYYADKLVRGACLKAQREEIRELTAALRERNPTKVYEHARNIVRDSVWLFHLGSGQIVNLKTNGLERLARYQQRAKAEDGILGIRSPWPVMDNETSGFVPGALTTIVARLGVGKTWLALLIGVHAERQGKNVGFISLEMSYEQIEMRRDAIKYQLAWRDLKRGELDFAALEEYEKALKAPVDPDAPNWFIASGGRVTNIAEAELFVEETSVDILIVDGIYLMDEGGPNTPMHERVMQAVRGLKRLGQKKNIPTICTAQFNRTVKKGTLQAGSEAIGHTDAIGQDSDNVIGMFRDKEMREANHMLISALKVRDGVPFEMTLDWDFDQMVFSVVQSGVIDDKEDGDKTEEDEGVMF